MSDSETLLDTRLTSDIVAAYVTNNTIGPEALPALIGSVREALRQARVPAISDSTEKQRPAVPVSRSVQPDFLICLEDGEKLKMLKRHLRTKFNLSPQAYRTKWGLPPDYPMVAPNYANRRSQVAKDIGLGVGVRRKQEQVRS